MTYKGRDNINNNIFNVSVKGYMRQYELLNVIEFSSARKRMTSVFRELQTGRICVMCKGADSVLLPLLRDPESTQVKNLKSFTQQKMDSFAREGLRTLLIVEKTLTEAEYSSWNEEY